MSKVYRKLIAFGGKGGQVWDDDVCEGVRKVYVGKDEKRITYVKFEYIKEDDQVVTREYGKVNQQPIEFVVEYPEEHIIAVEGNYRTVGWLDTDVITNLLFKTSKGRQSPLFGPDVTSRTKNFHIGDAGKKIVGFHGRSGSVIDAFGAYLVHDPLPPIYKLDAQGGEEGSVWDDGTYDNVKSLIVCQDDCRITYLEIDYEKAGKLETRHHGKKGKTPLKFELNPDEYIKSVEATFGFPEIFGRDHTIITSLRFETSKGRKSEIYGYEKSLKSKKFLLEQKGGKIVGFHGAEGSAIDSLGAYFTPVHTPPPQPIPHKKLTQVGGNGGDLWDDGVYDDVKKIVVGRGHDGVAFVKFEYSKGKDLVSGDGHGEKTLFGTEEFVLEDGEYLTSIDVYYDTVYGIEAPLITGIKFQTNKKESTQFGIGVDGREKFTFEEKDHKIVGFHGQAGDYVHSIGVTLAPVTPTE